MSVDYSELPAHMQGAAQRYVENGLSPGGFLTAVLSNNLLGAASKADAVNRRWLYEWAQWLYNQAPANCHGSYQIVESWLESGGLVGQGELTQDDPRKEPQ